MLYHFLWRCRHHLSCSLLSTHNFLTSFPHFFRYIYYFGGLLSGTIKMNSSPLFLHQILIPSLPNFQTGGGQFYTNKWWYNSLQWCNGNYELSIVNRECFTMSKPRKNNRALSAHNPPFFFFFFGCYPHFSLYSQVSIPSWKSISLYSWSTPQAFSKYIVICPVVPQGFQTSFCPFDRCCLYRPVFVFRRRLVCAYVKIKVVYQCFTQLRHVFD